ncbi:hypothetical protein RSOLAG22IIIB_11880 [Rhizoctonia solani]|uniref:Uncharacterized protein n=1 Tax=Rhizoctonia solani TaxID=456999 RepID=A0A0K6GAZ9_9AGAM|nr:hypothetical protein RSOLAG22IIIB_11880 [Rhizoctonia solani]
MSARNLKGNKEQNFNNWADSVGLLTEIRELDDVCYQHTPEAHTLNALLSNTKTIPKWLGDLESPKYTHFKSSKYYGPIVSAIHRRIGSRFELSDNDPTLDKEVEHCLPFLLSICASVYDFTAKSTEADKRCFLNALLATLWSAQAPNMFQSLERPLRLPEPASTAAIIPHSSAFFTIEFRQYWGLSQRAIEGCTALHGNGLKAAKSVLHWVTVSKPDLGLEEARQQVYEGLTTALYQRRALGFTDQFVFGTCHYNQIRLEVVAATWVSSDDEDNEEDSARTPRKADNALPPTAIRKSSDKEMDVDDAPGLHQLEGAHNQGEQQVDDAKLIRDLDQRNKIAVYRLGTYCMRDADSMIAFYLLMRGTRALAMEYREAITTSSVARIKVMEDTNPKLFDWYNPPLESKSQVGSKASLGSSEEQKELDSDPDVSDSDSDLDSDSDSDSPSPLGGDIEEITWEEKVNTFLASSLVDSQELPHTAHLPENDATID